MTRLPARTAALTVAAFFLAPAAAGADTIKATFACAGGKSIEAAFETDKVMLKLSDGRMLTLAQTPSAGGARYANAGETEVFWNTGNTATLSEGADQKTTYADCTAK